VDVDLEFFEVRSSTPAEYVLTNRKMPGAEWFADATLNWGGHV
jgi:acetoacetyl-CoA synthetase